MEVFIISGLFACIFVCIQNQKSLYKLVFKQNVILRRVAEKFVDKLEETTDFYLDELDEREGNDGIEVQVIGVAGFNNFPSPAPSPPPTKKDVFIFNLREFPRKQLDVLEKQILQGTGCWIETNQSSLRNIEGQIFIDVYVMAYTLQEVKFAKYLIEKRIEKINKLNVIYKRGGEGI